MSDRRGGRYGEGASKRQCARFGCSAVATATYTFDTETRTVWLDTPFEGAARAGELCTRHARLLTPPRGWKLEDRRTGASDLPARAAGARELPALDVPTRATSDVATGPPATGPMRAELDDELRGLLDAQSPLLARAFRSAGTF